MIDTLQVVDLGKFARLGLVEINQGRFEPVAVQGLDITADRRLTDAQLLGNVRLNPAV